VSISKDYNRSVVEGQRAGGSVERRSGGKEGDLKVGRRTARKVKREEGRKAGRTRGNTDVRWRQWRGLSWLRRYVQGKQLRNGKEEMWWQIRSNIAICDDHLSEGLCVRRSSPYESKLEF